MRKIAILVLAGITLGMSGTASFAGETCQCRAGGQYYDTGSLICLGKGENSQMARCEMALNNTSWKMLGEQCPYALSVPPKGQPAKNQPALTPWRKISAL